MERMQEVAAKRCQDEPEVEASPRAERVRELFSEHGDFVWRTLRRLGVAAADADDALKETFLVVFRRIDEYQDRGLLHVG
jgi:DNA-directed RNA polymerase specialized sigma24 family protein